MGVLDYFGKGYNCSQSVFTVYADTLGIDEHISKSIGAAFGGGLGGRQQLCGAVSGALMVIGAKFYDDDRRDETKQLIAEKSREFMDAFAREKGSIICADLLGVPMDEARAKGYFESKCNVFVESACSILDALGIN